MHRFFADGGAVRGEEAALAGAHARQIATVLRLRPGDEITLVIDGEEIVVTLERVSATAVRGRVRERRPADGEPRVALTLALPLLRGARGEEVIEAVAQLGVTHVVPFTSSRSVVRTLAEARRVRWERIAREAAETSRRGRAPAIERARPWPELLDGLPAPVLVAWELAQGPALLEALAARPRSLSLVIGPEGGLEAEEVAQARARGATTVSLGRRNLRSETAAIAAVAVVMQALD